MTPTICLITPGHLASAPRVVKEADALVAAGYRVHVVAGRHYAPVDSLDEGILARAKWDVTRVDYRRGGAVWIRKFLRKFSRATLRRAPRLTLGLAARAHHAESLHLGAVAARTPAALFIGHCLAGLPAAARAAEARGARCGFDAEDFHDAESVELVSGGIDGKISPWLQSRLLPRCDHLTAAAPLMSDALEKKYGVRATTVLNTFPLADAPRAPVAPGPITSESPARLYWFSQTIGPGRGLEATIVVLARLQTPVELQLRGFGAESYRTELQAFARRAGLVRPIVFLAPGAPGEMVRLAAPAHLGLSLEETTPLNRDLCLTNKIFVYLLAGLPQLLTPTSAQRSLAAQLDHAALLFDPAQPEKSAAQIDALLGAEDRLAAARAAAWQLGQTRFNWEREQQALVTSVQAALARPVNQRAGR